MVFFKRRGADLTTGRIEAFSDGVFAIAITLHILEIKIPHLHGNGDSKTLAQTLRELWPSYFAYVFSFITIGIYWANHHYIFSFYKRADHIFNLLNVFFLMCISFLPFPTAVLGEYVTDPHERHTAVVFYTIGLLLPALAWSLKWLYASRGYCLIDERLAPAFVRSLTRRYLLSPPIYALGVLAAVWNSTLGLAICIGLTTLYLLPPIKPAYRTEPSSD